MPLFDPMDHENPPEDVAAVSDLADEAFNAVNRGVAVEIGVWAGATTLLLADQGFRTFAVDHWQGNPDDRLGDVARSMPPNKPFLTFCHNCGPYLFHSIFPLFGTSKQWAYAWQTSGGQFIDFLYIDADHQYEAVCRDIELWTRQVRPGGIIAGHDYGVFEGVTRAVEESGAFEVAGRTVWWRRKE